MSPQLKLTTPLTPPILIEVSEHVEPSVKARRFEVVEVGVDVELAAPPNLMEAAAN